MSFLNRQVKARHFVALLVLTGCSTTTTTVTGPDIDIILPGVTPSPVPSGGPKGVVTSVTFNGIPNGEHCTTGTPANDNKAVGVGCYLDGTINPRDANGAVIFDTTVTGERPEAFVQRGESSAGNITQDGTNAFNWRLTCTARGSIVVSATVKGVSSGDVTFSCK